MNNMMLIHSEWEGQKSFRIIPTDQSCPYTEGIFDPQTQILVLFLKGTKEAFHMVPKIDDNGDPIMVKRERPNGKSYKEERRVLQTYHEYYLSNVNDIESFIKIFAINCERFDYSQYLAAVKATA